MGIQLLRVASHQNGNGPAWYGPLYRDHPWLGDGSPLATARHILQSVRLMWASVLVFAALASLLSALMAYI